jgi:hypothetical protein
MQSFSGGKPDIDWQDGRLDLSLVTKQRKIFVCMKIFQFGNAWCKEAVSVTWRIHKRDIKL